MVTGRIFTRVRQAMVPMVCLLANRSTRPLVISGELCSSFHAHSDRINKSMGDFCLWVRMRLTIGITLTLKCECIDCGQGFIGVVVICPVYQVQSDR